MKTVDPDLVVVLGSFVGYSAVSPQERAEAECISVDMDRVEWIVRSDLISRNPAPQGTNCKTTEAISQAHLCGGGSKGRTQIILKETHIFPPRTLCTFNTH